MNRHKRQFRGWTVGVAVSAATGCLALGLPAAALATMKPSIDGEAASQITQHSASLQATINPEGSETSYEIWFLPGCSAGACERVAPRVVAKAADIGNGQQGLVVGAQLTELEPGLSNNEYWVVASNSAGKSESARQTFATPPQPRIETESVSQVTVSDATLEATVNPEGLPKGADYQFQLVKNTNEYLPELVCAENGLIQPVGNDGCLDPPGWPLGAIPLYSVGGLGGQPVSLELASVGVALQSDTTYHYRVLAAESLNGEDGVLWEAPPAIGPDQTFTTPKSAEEEATQKLVQEHAKQVSDEAVAREAASKKHQEEETAADEKKHEEEASKPPIVKAVALKVLTKAEELTKARRACKREPKKKRATCEKRARKQFAPKQKKKSKRQG